MEQKDPSYDALLSLGALLREVTPALAGEPGASHPDSAAFDAMLQEVSLQNPWFTRPFCLQSLQYWADVLQPQNTERWLGAYPAPSARPLSVGLVLAGNIPLVGFHDLICVLLTGNRARVKCASNDRILMPFMVDRLADFEPEIASRVSFTNEKLPPFDAVIATGSNNTGRYFEYYFSKKPHIIRKNRHGAAVLNGAESGADLQGLAEDVFRYFGMGCRSVSKLFVPEGYDFGPMFQAFYRFKHLIDHQKYANNYDYNKAVYLMSGSPMQDNGFLLIKADTGFGSPIGTLFYETYPSEEALRSRLEASKSELQCLVGGPWLEGATPFGQAQHPPLWEYADGVDTMAFLLETSGV